MALRLVFDIHSLIYFKVFNETIRRRLLIRSYIFGFRCPRSRRDALYYLSEILT